MSETPLGAETTTEAVAGSREYITLELGGQAFAVDIGPLQEIVRPPTVVSVPLSPPAIRGVANLRGQVLPVADLREMAGLPVNENDDSTRVLVVDAGGLVGLIVDRVRRVLFVDEHQVDRTVPPDSGIDPALVAGVVRPDDTGMMLILNLQALVERAIAMTDEARRAREAIGRAGAAGEAGGAEEAGDDRQQLVAFRVGDEEFALPIGQIREVVRPPESISRVPGAGEHVLGIMNLRRRSLPVASLRRMYGDADGGTDERQRVLVVPTFGDRNQVAAPQVGLLADEVNEVLRVPAADLDPVPPLLGGDGDGTELTGVCRLDGGRRLVSVIAPERLFQLHDMQAAIAAGHQQSSEDGMQDHSDGEDDGGQFVVFSLAGEEYGVAIGDAKEIVRVPENLTRVPRAPAFLEGVINLRGAVLPVIDLRHRFGLPTQARDDAQRIMVLNLDGNRTGFIVDSVTEVLRIPAACVQPAPYMAAEQAEVIREVANLADDGRMVQLVASQTLLSEGERTALGELDAAGEVA